MREAGLDGPKVKNRILRLALVVGASLLSLGTIQARLTPYARSLYDRRSKLRLGHKRKNTRHASRNAKYYPAPTPGEIDKMVADSASKFQMDPQFVHAII